MLADVLLKLYGYVFMYDIRYLPHPLLYCVYARRQRGKGNLKEQKCGQWARRLCGRRDVNARASVRLICYPYEYLLLLCIVRVYFSILHIVVTMTTIARRALPVGHATQ